MFTIHLAPVPTDNTPAIVGALTEIRAHQSGTLFLEPGQYPCSGGAIHPDGRTHEPSVALAGLDNVTIDGAGATLVGSDIAGLFRVMDSHNFTVKNLTVDWNPLPHTSGRVVAVHPEDYSFDFAPQIPANPVAGRIVQGILAYDPARHRLAENGWEVYQTEGERDADPMEQLPGGLLRVYQTRHGRLPEVGWDVVVRHQVYGYDAFVFANCENVEMDDVTIHAAPGMGVIGWGSKDITIRRIKIVPSDGGWMSTTADAMHFNHCRGTVTVADSEFAGMGDDAINIHGMYGLAMAKLDDHTLAIARARMNPYYDKFRDIWDLPAPGDVLEYGGGDQPLLPQGTLTVAEAHQDADKKQTIVRFTDPLPPGVDTGTVFADTSTSPKIRITNCYVHGNRARGFLLQSRDVQVTNCRFEDISGAGIQICTDGGIWWESLGSRDVTIQNCTFTRCNFGVAHRAAALDIFSDLDHGRQSSAGVHQRLHILDNTFEGNGGAAINVGSAEGVEVRGNHISQASGAAVVVENSRNVNISGNDGLAQEGGVKVGIGCEKVVVGE